MVKCSKLAAFLMIALMALSVALAGCGQTTGAGGAEESTSGSSPAGTSEEPVREAVTLQFWQFWNIADEADSIKPIIDKFNSENPDIKLEPTKLGWGDGFTRIQTAVGAGAAPDVLELGSTWVGAFADAGALTDLKPLLTEDIKDRFVNWGLGEYGDQIVAFPWAVGTRALAVNYELCEKAGVDPKSLNTWDDLYNAAKTIKEKTGVPGFNIAAGDPTGDWQTFGAFLYSAGGSFLEMDEEGWACSINSDAARKAFAFFEKIRPYASADTEANTQIAFQSGKLGMFIVGSYQTASMINNNSPVENWGYETIPANPETGKSFAFTGAEVLTIPMQAKNKEASFKALTYLADEETAVAICRSTGWSIVPSTKTASQLSDFTDPQDDYARRVVKFLEIANEGKTFAPPNHKSIEDIGGRISVMVQEVVLNGVNADKAIEEAEKDINKLWLKR